MSTRCINYYPKNKVIFVYNITKITVYRNFYLSTDSTNRKRLNKTIPQSEMNTPKQVKKHVYDFLLVGILESA